MNQMKKQKQKAKGSQTKPSAEISKTQISQQEGDHQKQKKSLNRRILQSNLGFVFLLVVICCGIMVVSMRSLTNNLLLDNLQPLARQSAKTVEANVHLLADRLITLSEDSRLLGEAASRQAVFDHAKEVYELYTIALYDTNGNLLQGDQQAASRLDTTFFTLLQQTDNLTIAESTLFNEQLGITMGMPVTAKAPATMSADEQTANGQTAGEPTANDQTTNDQTTDEQTANDQTMRYIVVVYKYDALGDVLNDIHVGQNGRALIINQKGQIVGSPDSSIALQSPTLVALRGSDYRAVNDKIITGETGSAEAQTADGEQFLAFSPIRGTPWFLAIEIPRADYARLTNHAILMVGGVALILLILSVLGTIRLSRSISQPISKATQRMVGLAEGNLHDAVDVASSEDELAMLTGTLRTTVSSLNQYISEIDRVLSHIASGDLNVDTEGDYEGDFGLIRDSLHHIIGSMNQTMNDFQNASFRLADIAEQLNQQSSRLHQSSMEQSMSATQLVDEVTVVRSHLENVNQSTGRTRDKASEIAQLVGEADTQMQQLSEAMQAIDQNANEITRIAKALESIATQTNILALNASIEAAHAGVAGKGFAVVAEEVRDLAIESTKEAKAATEMAAKTNAIIHTGVNLTLRAATSIHSVTEVSEQINGFTRQLFEAVQEQTNSLLSMEEKIETISTLASQNQQSAEESEQSSGILSQEAGKLQSQVQKFKLKGERGQ